ncbi:MAG: hypothetical protein KGH64_00720 [Candidatus Micrarchaeota archaeon]|nr:hypothetical protein [Candidatus Micrarchaeota archaeon]
MTMGKIYRQGDCLLIEVEKLPDQLKQKDNILLLGEATGHHHKIENGIVYADANGMQYVQVQKEATLTHQEHEWLTLPKGNYQMRRQREYSPLADRQVQD